MAAQYTTTLFLSDVRTGGMFPAASALTFSDDDILRLADREMQSALVPMMMSVREEYFVTTVDMSITPGAALNTLRIPSRAIGGKIRDFSLISGTTTIAVPQLEASGAVAEYGNTGYTLQGNLIQLANPNIAWSTSTARIAYYLRPNRLRPLTSVGTIQTISTGAQQVTLDQTPLSPTGVYDLVRSHPGYECLAIDQAAAGTTTLTFTNALPTDLAVGDYICNPEETPVPQVPPELHPVLVQMVICKMLEALGDATGLQAAQGKLQEVKAAAMVLIEPRVDGAPKRVRNMASPFRRRRWPVMIY